MSIPEQIEADRAAMIFDLQRRVRDLEYHNGIVPMYSDSLPALVELYLDAMRTPTFDEITARHWSRQLSAITTKALLELARTTNDPFPWRPFLRVADLYSTADIPFDTALSHVLETAQQLLDIQGLSRLKPRDVMGHPLPNLDKLFPPQAIRS